MHKASRSHDMCVWNENFDPIPILFCTPYSCPFHFYGHTYTVCILLDDVITNFFHLPPIFQLFLEAPEDILCFKFNPSDPNIVAGGCINGQVSLVQLTLSKTIICLVLSQLSLSTYTSSSFTGTPAVILHFWNFMAHACIIYSLLTT